MTTRWGGDALTQLKAASDAHKPYRIVIMDITATDDDGDDLARSIEIEAPGTHVLILDRYWLANRRHPGRWLCHARQAIARGPPGGGPLKRTCWPVSNKRRCVCSAATMRARRDKEFQVFVAEDNRTNQMVAAGMLAMNGCACEFASEPDARKRWRRRRTRQFDLILDGLQHAGNGRL